MPSKVLRFGPQSLGIAAADILSPGTTAAGKLNGATFTTGSYTNLMITLRHIRIVNKDTVARTFSLYIGATGGSAAGTEFMGTAVSVPANSYVDWYGMLALYSGDFLTGLASSATTLTIEGEGNVDVQ